MNVCEFKVGSIIVTTREGTETELFKASLQGHYPVEMDCTDYSADGYELVEACLMHCFFEFLTFRQVGAFKKIQREKYVDFEYSEVTELIDGDERIPYYRARFIVLENILLKNFGAPGNMLLEKGEDFEINGEGDDFLPYTKAVFDGCKEERSRSLGV